MEGGDIERGDEIVVYPSRWKLVLLAVGALVFVLLGLWIGGFFGDRKAGIGIVFVTTYVGVPFFGFCLVYAAYRLMARKPSLVVSKEGIFDNASALGAGMVRWDEIKEIYGFEYGGQPMLGIIPHDKQAILARQNPIKRRIMRINTENLGIESVVNIPQNALPMSIEELLRRVDGYLAARESYYSS